VKRWFGAVVIVCVMALMSCGPDISKSDRDFVGSMIPHHLVGVKLLDDAAIRTNDVRLRRLVFEMQGYHHAEIHELEAMANEWSVAPRDVFPGYIGTADFADLARASGVDYDVRWLNLMIRHHKGALQLAKDALQSSASSHIHEIAVATLSTQSREVSLMQHLHGSLCRNSARPESCNE